MTVKIVANVIRIPTNSPVHFQHTDEISLYLAEISPLVVIPSRIPKDRKFTWGFVSAGGSRRFKFIFPIFMAHDLRT